MSAATSVPVLTAEEFMALPDNGRDRMLIRGHLLEKKMTYRNAFHSTVMMHLGFLLSMWLEANKHLKLKVVGGEAGIRLHQDPPTIVGVDVAVIRAEANLYSENNRTIFDEPPLLAVEILSPSDRQREIDIKIDEYLSAGVPLVWIINPHHRTVVAYQPHLPPQLFAGAVDLTAEPTLPGFRIPVSRVFETL